MDESLDHLKRRRSTRARAFLDLVRLPNLFTAAADVLAGFFFAGGLAGEWFVVVRLAAASVCLYAGGVVLNDVCDAVQDADERPQRPLPSGVISRSTALYISLTFLAFALLVSATVSGQALLVSAAITASILLYNFLKQTPLAPPLMGLCRSWNLLLGMHGMETLLPMPAIRPMAAMFLYVTSLTVFARREAGETSRLRIIAGCAGMALAVISIWGFRWYGYNARYADYRYLVAAMLAGILYCFATVTMKPSPLRVQRAVKMLVLGIVLLDACVAWVSAGHFAALAVLTLLVPSLLLARFLRVT